MRRWAIQEDSIFIITGPIFTKNKGTIGSDKVTVPGYYYKVIYNPTGVKKMIAFILPNVKAKNKQLEKGFDPKLWKF